MNRILKVHYSPRVKSLRVLCGLGSDYLPTTDDKAKVTCKRCLYLLRLINGEERP